MSNIFKEADKAANAVIGIPSNALNAGNNLVKATDKLTEGFSNEAEGIGEGIGKTLASSGKLTSTTINATNEGVQMVGETLKLGNDAIGGLSDYAKDKRKEKKLKREIRQKAREETQAEQLELKKVEMKLKYDKKKMIAEKKSEGEKNKIRKALHVIELAADKAERDNMLLKNCFNKFEGTDKSSKVIHKLCKKQRKCLDWKDTNTRMYSWYNCEKFLASTPEFNKGGKKRSRKNRRSQKTRRSKKSKRSRKNRRRTTRKR
jgi:hypothetical protein